MATTRNYSIHKNRIRKGCLSHMECMEDNSLLCEPQAGTRTLFLGYLDSGMESCQWGRFHFQGQFAENVVVITRIAARNHKEIVHQGNRVVINDFLLDVQISDADKKILFQEMNGKRIVNKSDLLLYELEGRYLWISLEVLGIGEGRISNMKVNLEGDNFMYTFPEIYQERNSFFHRYLSIFSSIYNDFQQEIDRLPKLLDIDTAPLQLLPVFGRWLGIEIDIELLEEKKLRILLKEAYQLNKYKGTIFSIKRIMEIVLEEEVMILEKNLMKRHIPFDEKETYERLYGDSSYDITILIKKYESQSMKAQLIFLLKQFLPVRAKMNLVFMEETGELNSYCYLDYNAKTNIYQPGVLDQEQTFHVNTILI